MADSGAVERSGLYEARVLLSSSAVATFALQRRNAANDDNVAPFPFTVYTQAQTAEYVLLVTLEASERFRVAMGANLTGDAQALIQLERLS